MAKRFTFPEGMPMAKRVNYLKNLKEGSIYFLRNISV